MPESYQKITPTQLERWLKDATTKTFLQCLGWKYEDFRDANGLGKFVDSSNADMTHATMHLMLGRMEGMKIAQDAEALMTEFEMIDYPPPEEEPDDDTES